MRRMAPSNFHVARIMARPRAAQHKETVAKRIAPVVATHGAPRQVRCPGTWRHAPPDEVSRDMQAVS